jgi:hypothetical protein
MAKQNRLRRRIPTRMMRMAALARLNFSFVPTLCPRGEEDSAAADVVDSEVAGVAEPIKSAVGVADGIVEVMSSLSVTLMETPLRRVLAGSAL